MSFAQSEYIITPASASAGSVDEPLLLSELDVNKLDFGKFNQCKGNVGFMSNVIYNGIQEHLYLELPPLKLMYKGLSKAEDKAENKQAGSEKKDFRWSMTISAASHPEVFAKLRAVETKAKEFLFNLTKQNIIYSNKFSQAERNSMSLDQEGALDEFARRIEFGGWIKTEKKRVTNGEEKIEQIEPTITFKYKGCKALNYPAFELYTDTEEDENVVVYRHYEDEQSNREDEAERRPHGIVYPEPKDLLTNKDTVTPVIKLQGIFRNSTGPYISSHVVRAKKVFVPKQPRVLFRARSTHVHSVSQNANTNGAPGSTTAPPPPPPPAATSNEDFSFDQPPDQTGTKRTREENETEIQAEGTEKRAKVGEDVLPPLEQPQPTSA